MVKFIKLTKTTEVLFWLNVDNIISIYGYNNGSKLEVDSKVYTFIDVNESPAEIFSLMHGEIPCKSHNI